MTLNSVSLGVEDRRARLRILFAPRSDGLPTLAVLCGVPLVFLLMVTIGTAFGLSGSSTGMWWQLIHGDAPDPNLIAGAPRAITSDMWFVQDSWIASQAAQGFPAVNHTFPGGMDATFMNDLPAWDWSTLFRPHLWAYLVLPLAQGGAWRWLFIGGLAAAAVYMFAVSAMPRRPLVALLLSGFVLASPLIQWWYRPQTLLPLAWCFLTLTAVIWALRARPGSRTPVVLALLAGYFAVPAALTIYVPFIIPCVWAVLLLSLAKFLESRRGIGTRASLARLLPLIVSGGAAALVIVIWAATRLDTIRATMGTIYPGHRNTPTGQCLLDASSCTATFAAAWSRSLEAGIVGSLGGNPPEAASVIQLELYLAPVLLFLLIRSLKRGRVDWSVASALAGAALFLAFILVPGWDPLADALGLASSVGARMRLGLLIVGVISVVVVITRHDQDPWDRRTTAWLMLGVGSVAFAVQMIVWVLLRSGVNAVTSTSRIGGLAVLAVIAGSVLLLSNHPWVGIGGLVVTSLVVAGQVNPLYVGWTDLAQGSIGRAVIQTEHSAPGRWIGVTTDHTPAASMVPTGVLLATGVEAYNGVQTYPPARMWSQIDPSGTFRNEWNRLAGVRWVPGSGDPVVSNPARDQIRVTFDSCSNFAQSDVRHVLSLGRIRQKCLDLVRTVPEGDITGYVYTVVAR